MPPLPPKHLHSSRISPREQLTIQRKTGRDLFQVWIADTPARHQQGLMWVRRLAPDQGMLFLLDAPRHFDLWMKNTYVSLDMVFFDETGRVLGIARNTTPLSTAIVSSPGEVAGVLEILAGESATTGNRSGRQAAPSRVRNPLTRRCRRGCLTATIVSRRHNASAYCLEFRDYCK